ncbi:hypothetical protein PILCRDRAFT_134386 [Piloderma croceum F 1598]|uniref:Uncharacterized protein n=1 Tax=Piloderma croceum (strain F 1598) TaxID=765440 RepID=A0A0C3G5X2_PILCF|nr:hypothetical protein PILCRDRAFT_134386 [Piloderma croceum F 1598]
MVDRGGSISQDGYASTHFLCFSGVPPRDFYQSSQLAPYSAQSVANATHGQLMQTGNQAHTQLYHEFLKVKAKAETLENAYTTLANAASNSLRLLRTHYDHLFYDSVYNIGPLQDGALLQYAVLSPFAFSDCTSFYHCRLRLSASGILFRCSVGGMLLRHSCAIFAWHS